MPTEYNVSGCSEIKFNEIDIEQVYFDNELVWQKPKVLGFTFNGNEVASYFGGSLMPKVPLSYSTFTDFNGNIHYVEGNDYQVDTIGEGAFKDSQITAITIPEGIVEIKKSAFENSKITKISLPDSTKTLGEACFKNCYDLSVASLNRACGNIPNYAFYQCTSLSSVTTMTFTRSVGDYAFYKCQSLDYSGLSYQTLTLGNWAYAYCTGFKSFYLLSGIESIGDFCFLECVNMNIIVDDELYVKSIGKNAFVLVENITNLKYLVRSDTTLSTGCLGIQTSFCLSSSDISYAVMEKIRASQSNGTIYKSEQSGYEDVWSTGSIYATYLNFGVQKSGGNDSPSMTAKATMTVTTGLTSFTVTNQKTMGNSGESTYYVFNSTLTPNPTLSVSYSVSSSSNVSSHSGSQTSKGFYTSNGVYAYRIDYRVNVVATCLVEGTLITLMDGTHKPVENLGYGDLLRVWNFEKGEFDYQFPLAIVKGEEHGVKYRLTIEDGTYLEVCGQHDIFDPIAHKFRTYGDGAIHEMSETEDYYVMKDIGIDDYLRMRITNIEIIYEKVTAYCVVTSGTITAFANDMMIGMNTLNLAPIGNENKFTQQFQYDKETCYNYNRFKQEIYDGATQDLILGLNLHFVDYYNKDARGLPILLAPFMRRKPLPQYEGKNLYNIAFDDGYISEIKSFENEVIVMPEITTPGKTRWYIVGEYKYLQPGDTYITKFSTVIKAV